MNTYSSRKKTIELLVWIVLISIFSFCNPIWGAQDYVELSVTPAFSAPEAISNLTALPGENGGEITLKWTAPFSQVYGDAEKYLVKYATYQITTDLFNDASTYAQNWQPLQGGNEEGPEVLTGFTEGVLYYFAIKAYVVDKYAVWNSSWDVSEVNTANFTIAKGIPPAAITNLSALTGPGGGEIGLSWTTPGDDGWDNTLTSGSKYHIQYASWTVSWSTSSTEGYYLDISTSGVTPGTTVHYTINGLTSGTTYYFRIWTADEVPNWSGLSNGATAQAEYIILSVVISPTTWYDFGLIELDVSTIVPSGITVTNNGNVTQKYSLKCATFTQGVSWGPGSNPGFDTFTLKAGFHPSKPLVENFGSEDIVYSTDTVSTTETYSIDGTEKGENIPANGARTMWLLLNTPLDTSTTVQQRIRTYITAEQQ